MQVAIARVRQTHAFKIKLLGNLHQVVQFQHQISQSCLSDPSCFDGKLYHLQTWLPSVKAKLCSDQIHEADVFDYVWNHLEQSQQASVLHLCHAAEEAQI